MRRALSVLLAFALGCLSAVLVVAPASAAAVPVILRPADNSYTADQTPVISGTGLPGAFITVKLDGQQRNDVATAAGNGTWSWTVPGALTLGGHTVSARQFDNAGTEETSAFSATNSFTAGPNPPFVFSPPDGTSTTDTRPTFSGGGLGGQIIKAYIDGVYVAPDVTVGGAGDWEWTPASPIAAGAHTFYATATQSNVESPPSETINFTIESLQPDPPVVSSPGITADNTPTITGTADPGVASVRVFIDGTYRGSVTPNGQGEWEFTSPSLTDGDHQVYAVARDAQSNDSDPSETSTFVVDTTAPDPPAVLVPANGDATGATPTVSGTAEGGSTIRVFIDGTQVGVTVADGDGTWSFSAPALSGGSHTVQARAVDQIGNVSALSNGIDFSVDATAPAAPVILVPTDDVVTNDVGQSVSGTGEPGATVHLSVAGDIYDVVVDGNGDWQWSPGDPLPDGVYPVSTTQTDPYGNVSDSAEITFTIDTQALPPIIADPVSGGYLGAAGPITGTAEPGATIHINLDDQDAGTVVADSNGSWSFNPPTLSEGGHSVLTYQVDRAGNQSGPSAQADFTVDSTPPAAPQIVVPVNNAVTNDSGQAVSGTGEPGATINLSINGFVAHVVVDPDGNWGYTPGDPFPDGDYTLTATQTDPAGNVSTVSDEITFTIDTGADPPVITDPLQDGYLGATGPIKGTAEPGATVHIILDDQDMGTVTADSSGNWVYVPGTALTDGGHSILTYQADVGGNQSTPSQLVSFTVDTLAPQSPEISSPADDALLTSGAVTVAGVGEPGATVSVQIDGGGSQTALVTSAGRWTLALTVTDGTHNITALQTDPAGNESEGEATISVTVDTAAPAAPVIEAPEPGYVSPIGDFQVAGLGEVGSTVTVYVDGVASGTALVDPNGEWAVDITPARPTGTYAVTARLTDPAGNNSNLSSTLSVDVDRTAPLAPEIEAPSPGDKVFTATPTVTGTGEPGATVTVKVDGVEVGTGVVQSDGTWSATTSPLAEGGVTLTVTLTDPVGNASPGASVGVTIDTTAPARPVLSTPVDGAAMNMQSPVLTGTAEPNSVLTVLVDGVPYATFAVDATGEFSFPLSPPLEDDTYQISLVASDGGNTSPTTTPITITLDTVEPQPPTIDLPADQTEIGTGQPPISGTGEVGSTVTIKVDAVTVGTAVVDVSGNWTFSPSTPISDGLHTIQTTQTDAAGNTSLGSAEVTVEIDTTAPAAPEIIAPFPGELVGPLPSISGSAEPATTLRVSIDGVEVAVIANDDGNWSYTMSSALADGSHEVSVTCEDAQGNVSAATRVTFQVDATIPNGPVIVSPGDGAALADGSVVLTGTSEPGALVSVLVDGVEVGSATADGAGDWSLTIMPALAEGTYAITARQIDPVGNVSGTSMQISITVDTTSPPRPIVLEPTAGARLYTDTPTVGGTGEPGATVSVKIGGVEVGTTVVNPDGSWVLTTDELPDGASTLVVTQTDPAGNESASTTVTVTVDTTAPAVPVLLTPADGDVVDTATPEVTGTAEPGSTLSVLVDGVVVDTFTVGSSGEFSYTFPPALADGSHVITLRAADGGNTSDPSVPVTITVDTVTPDAPVVTNPADEDQVDTHQPTLTGTGEPGANVMVAVDGVQVGEVVVDETGSWTLTLTAPLDDGPHALSVTQTDLAGNISEPTTSSFVVDTLAPATPVVVSPDGTNQDASVGRVSGTAEPGSTITVYLDGSLTGSVTVEVDPDGNWSVELPELSEGAHTFVVSATDGAGNESAKTEPITFQAIDSPLIMSPADGDVYTTPRPVFTGVGEPGATIEVRESTTGNFAAQQLQIKAAVPGRVLATGVVDADGNWTATPSQDLVSGVYTVAAYQVIEGLSTRLSPEVTFAITTQPVITSPAPGATLGRDFTICGTGEPGADIDIVDADGEVYGSTTVDDDGTWCANGRITQSGTYELAARQTTDDGVTVFSAPFTVIINAAASGGGSGDGNGDGDGSGGDGSNSLAKTGGPQLAAGLAGLTLTLIGGLALHLARRRARGTR